MPPPLVGSSSPSLNTSGSLSTGDSWIICAGRGALPAPVASWWLVLFLG